MILSEFLALAISFFTVVTKAIADVPAIFAQSILFVSQSSTLVLSSIAIFPTMISSVMYVIVFLGILGILGRLIFGGFGKQ